MQPHYHKADYAPDSAGLFEAINAIKELFTQTYEEALPLENGAAAGQLVPQQQGLPSTVI